MIAAAAEARRNAPTASANVNPPREEMSRAAPGVDQAMMIGTRVITVSTSPETPLPMEIAQIHEAICASEMSAARVASNTMTSDPEYPTRVATIPATIAEREISRRKDRRKRTDPSIGAPRSEERRVERAWSSAYA